MSPKPPQKRALKKVPAKKQVADKRRAKAKRDPHDRSHLKRVFTDAEIEAVCDLIRYEHLSETAALKKMGFHWPTWRDRRRENKTMDAAVEAAQKDLLDEMMDPGTILTILDKANRDNAHAVKVKVWGRFEFAGKIAPERFGTNHHKVDGSLRVLGLADVLKEISDAGGDVGPGPSSPV